jgi:hypothetical protein
LSAYWKRDGKRSKCQEATNQYSGDGDALHGDFSFIIALKLFIKTNGVAPKVQAAGR